MALSKKTTILLSPTLHERLVELSEARGESIGELVREAVREQYGMVSTEERLESVERIASLELPVGDVDEVTDESQPSPEELMPE